MSETRPDGGQAFPMSLRDYFAAMALQGWIANDAIQRIVSRNQISIDDAFPILAKGCYDIADAMLKARTK